MRKHQATVVRGQVELEQAPTISPPPRVELHVVDALSGNAQIIGTAHGFSAADRFRDFYREPWRLEHQQQTTEDHL